MAQLGMRYWFSIMNHALGWLICLIAVLILDDNDSRTVGCVTVRQLESNFVDQLAIITAIGIYIH